MLIKSIVLVNAVLFNKYLLSKQPISHVADLLCVIIAEKKHDEQQRTWAYNIAFGGVAAVTIFSHIMTSHDSKNSTNSKLIKRTKLKTQMHNICKQWILAVISFMHKIMMKNLNM